MGVVKDPVHGFIELSPLAERLMDTPEMQRLRRVKQLGMANLVYPGANHTRFEHSVGAYHLADRVCGHLGIDGEEVRAAALLHDLGHGPLSHVSEEVIREHGGARHEQVAADLLKEGRVGEVLTDEGLDPGVVGDLFRGRGRYGEVISSELDVDRVDYLARDAHYTGAHYGVTDYERLLHQLALVEEELVVRTGGIEAAESLLVSRFLMQPTVYRHHVSRIAKSMVKQALLDALQNRDLTPARLRSMDDCTLFIEMRDMGDLQAETADRIRNRRLYKRAVWRNVGEQEREEMDALDQERRAVEREIAEDADVPPHHVLLDPPGSPEMEELSIRTETEKGIQPIDRVSQLVAMLKKAQWENWMMGVYCPPEDLESVEKSAERILA